MARKRKSSDGLVGGNIAWIRSLGGGAQALLFLFVFGVLGGGGYLVFNASAAAKTKSVSSCWAKYTDSGLRANSYNNACAYTVQRFLMVRGLSTPNDCASIKKEFRPTVNLSADSDYGPTTAKYVACYQAKSPGLKVDGVAGKNTWGAIWSDCGSGDQLYGNKYKRAGVICS